MSARNPGAKGVPRKAVPRAVVLAAKTGDAGAPDRPHSGILRVCGGVVARL